MILARTIKLFIPATSVKLARDGRCQGCIPNHLDTIVYLSTTPQKKREELPDEELLARAVIQSVYFVSSTELRLTQARVNQRIDFSLRQWVLVLKIPPSSGVIVLRSCPAQ